MEAPDYDTQRQPPGDGRGGRRGTGWSHSRMRQLKILRDMSAMEAPMRRKGFLSLSSPGFQC